MLERSGNPDLSGRHKIYTYTVLGFLFLILIGAKEQCEVASLDMRGVGMEALPHSISVETKKPIPIDKPEEFELTLQNPRGNISIKGKDTQEIKIIAKKTLYARSAKGLARIEHLEIIYEESDNALDIKVPSVEELTPKFSELKVFNIKVDFTISVPRSLKKISINSTKGKITVENTYTNLAIESVNGKIKTDIEGKETTLRATNGDIDAKITGGKTSLASTNGDINAKIDNGVISATCMNGDVGLVLNSSRGGKIILANGDIEATINNPQDLKITARAPVGDIDFTGLKDLKHQKGIRGEEVIGVVGVPMKELLMQTATGDIKVNMGNKKSFSIELKSGRRD